MMNCSLRMVKTGFIILIVFMTGCATSPNWKRFTQGQFPARVQAVVFGNGITLDRDHTTRWGNWTASFAGSSLPLATNHEFDWIIKIKPLTCSNPVIGAKDCYLNLYRDDPLGCEVLIMDEQKFLVRFDVVCPTALQLEGS
jgi:hypothetical protein